MNSGIHLTKIDLLPAEYNQDCFGLIDLLQIDGNLVEMVQMNFMIDLEWFWSMLPNPVPTVLVCKQSGLKEHASLISDHIEVVEPKLMIPFGTHHTKAMILWFEQSLRIVIHTSNLVPGDWTLKTQGMYLSPKLVCGKSNCKFQHDFIQYLQHYGPLFDPIIARLQQYDFSPIRAQLVGSVPGYHRNIDEFGHGKLRKLLKQVSLSSAFRNRQVICQFSSIGSLGNDDRWLRQEFGQTLFTSKNQQDQTKQSFKSQFKLIFPSMKTVESSLEGLQGGGSLHLSKSNYTKQKYMMQYMNHWRSSIRECCIPHIKTFCCINEMGEFGWFLLTSANLSKAAWGAFQKQGAQLMIRSYELGVLLYSDLFNGKSMMNTKQQGVVYIPLPYDYPLEPYKQEDEIFKRD